MNSTVRRVLISGPASLRRPGGEVATECFGARKDENSCHLKVGLYYICE
jgi:hypothetical protein